MTAGRRPDPPEVQASKGYPGKRKAKVARQIAEAEELAKLLATTPGRENDPLAPPAFLDERFAPALAVWKDYAPQLAARHLLEPLDRHTFACFCVWLGEFVIANEIIARDGHDKKVATISGDYMWREHPAVGRRDTAMKYVLELSKRFGLTPLDRYQVTRDQASAPAGGLFSQRPADDEEKRVPSATDAPENDPIGAMNRFDSLPPPESLN